MVGGKAAFIKFSAMLNNYIASQIPFWVKFHDFLIDAGVNTRIRDSTMAWDMGVYYHPHRATSRELSPQLGLIKRITPKYKKTKKFIIH